MAEAARWPRMLGNWDGAVVEDHQRNMTALWDVQLVFIFWNNPWIEPWRMRKVQKRRAGMFMADQAWALQHFTHGAVKWRQKTHCSVLPRAQSQGQGGTIGKENFVQREEEPIIKADLELEGHWRKTTRQCACCLWGTASVLAWGLGSVGWAWNGCSSTQLPSNSGILYIFQALAQQGFIQCCQEKEWLQPCWSVSSFVVLASLPPNRQQHRTPLHPRPLRTPSTSFDNSKHLPAFY